MLESKGDSDIKSGTNVTESHRHLMYVLEELINFLNREKIEYWIDWGTMLGYKRHGNVIPWDYDCDLCMMESQYQKLLSVFSRFNQHKCDAGSLPESSNHNTQYKIGRLLCLPNAYNDEGCLWIKDANYPDTHLGIDVIKYKFLAADGMSTDKTNVVVKHCMNSKTCQEYPCELGGYDFSYDDIFPLKSGFMVGLPVSLPNKIDELIIRGYGPNFMTFPCKDYLKWVDSVALENSDTAPAPAPVPAPSSFQMEIAKKIGKEKFLGSPFRVMKEFKTLKEGLSFYCSLPEDKKEPFLVRSPPEFINLQVTDVVSRFKQEDDVLSWHETETELFNDTYHRGAKLYESWQKDELLYNIVDAPSKHLDLLPPELLDNFKNMSERAKYYAICYAMTKKNNLTKYHQDVLGDGWVYLDCGTKVWHIFDLKDLQYLEEHGYSVLSLKDMNFTELVSILDGYLWSKIYVGTMGPKDFIYFPQSWPHRVITYDKSFGICGYTKS